MTTENKNKKYTADDVDILNDREHVRIRTPMFFGDTNVTEYDILNLSNTSLSPQSVSFVPAVYKAVGEILDNTLDEFAHITGNNKTLTIDCTPSAGIYKISDNGRGIPIEKKKVPTGPNKTEEKWVAELLLGNLRSGRNFRDSDDKNVGIIGMNGVGAACTNFCSSEFTVDIIRDKQTYTQTFTDGAAKIGKPIIAKTASAKTGTTVQFELDPTVFKNGVALPDHLIKNRAIEIAATNPGLTVVFNGEKIKFKNGMIDVVKPLAGGKDVAVFTITTPDVTGEIFVIPNSSTSVDERMFTWVNSSYLFDGGKCNTQFLNAFFDKAIAEVERRGAKSKLTVTKNDVRYGITIIANLKLKNPTYDSQAKTRLSGPDLRKDMVAGVEAAWKPFVKQFDSWFDDCVLRAAIRQNRQATEAMDDDTKKKGKIKVDGLLDATSKIRTNCVLYVVEGESAKSQICEVRNPEFMGSYSLTGKFNNIRGCSPSQVSKMGKVVDLLKVIGLVPGKKAIRSNLNYGKLVISTDADHDGGDIFANMVNLIHTFWPELLSSDYEPYVYRLVAPNVCLVKGDQRIHFTTRAEYEKAKDKYKDKGWTVNYFKGLGSMSMDDWDMILSGKTNTEIPIIDDGKLDDTLELLFGIDADRRKKWLQGTDNE